MTSTDTPYWHPDRHKDRRGFLRARGQVKRALQSWFEAQGFIEVECGALQVSPGNEAHLHGFKTTFLSEDGARETPFYLHTSPEFSCKKLLAAGEEKIYDFARVYRNREVSALHAPEFTMLEWYRAGASLDDVMTDSLTFCRLAFEASAAKSAQWKGRSCDPFAEAEYLTLNAAFQRYAEIDLESVLEDREEFYGAAQKAGVHVAANASWGDIFSAVLVSRIEPHLGVGAPTLLYHYPICEAALAQPSSDDPRYADRFELYICGVELANGFNELTNAAEQRQRFEADMDIKEALYQERYPIDEDFLAALKLMPEASGVALGFDRLVMLASGARSVHDVIWTPFR